jgi:hypothetical protein
MAEPTPALERQHKRYGVPLGVKVEQELPEPKKRKHAYKHRAKVAGAFGKPMPAVRSIEDHRERNLIESKQKDIRDMDDQDRLRDYTAAMHELGKRYGCGVVVRGGLLVPVIVGEPSVV